MVPADYEERVYAGVLGKIIAVYLGRPFEGWTRQRILDELGEITYYVNDRHDVALKHHLLVVADDDISGTFVFPRAMADHHTDRPTPQQIGASWLNYLIEDRAVLWWGGLGNSTEHTAYLRLLAGEVPPGTGSARRNGTVVSEQVGAQIFVEGWAMTSPGDPERAADLAERAASVSHDGEALQAARVVAALVAGAFTEPEIGRLLDTATALVDPDCLIRRAIGDIREWHAGGADWRAGFARIEDRYGYRDYGGNCHVVPNHAVVINALVHSQGDFTPALSIVNSCGWDTDSNAGNVGAITGVRGGLAGIDAGPDWRGPVADRMYLPSADSGAVITDAAREAVTLAAAGRRRAGEPARVPKHGARFHFSFPGSVQGFTGGPGLGVANVAGPDGTRMLALRWPEHTGGEALTPTFIPPEATGPSIYELVASPTLYPGQRLTARVVAERSNPGPVRCAPVLHHYGADDALQRTKGPDWTVAPGAVAELAWTVPDTGGQPIANVGLAVAGAGALYLDWLTWQGAPEVTLTRPAEGGTMWRRAFVAAVDRCDPRWPEPLRLVQNRGTGLLIQGSRDWRDYQVSADVTPHLAEAVGVAARVQGLRRWYALRLAGRDTVALVRECHGTTVLASRAFPWRFGYTYQLSLEVSGARLRGSVDGVVVCDVEDAGPDLDSGAAALLVTAGRSATTALRITPAKLSNPLLNEGEEHHAHLR